MEEEEEESVCRKKRAVINLQHVALLPHLFSWHKRPNVQCCCGSLQLERHIDTGQLPRFQPCDGELGTSAGAVIETVFPDDI